MFRLDYISCVLTISAAILLGQKRWQGWLIAGINSILICDIAVNTSQLGFIPANVFCVALYAYNILGWRKHVKAHRDLDRLRPELDSRASPGKVDYAYKSAPQSRNTLRILFPRAGVAELQLGTTCCERSTPSFPDSHAGSPTKYGDLWNLLPCRDNHLYGELSVTEPTVGR